MCPCKEEEDGEEQTTDHLIFQCEKLHKQRNEIIKQKHWWQLAYNK
jgi:hypothetical protein